MSDEDYLNKIEYEIINDCVCEHDIHTYIHFLESKIGDLRSKSRISKCTFKHVQDDIQNINNFHNSVDTIMDFVLKLRLDVQLLIETMESYIFMLRNYKIL